MGEEFDFIQHILEINIQVALPWGFYALYSILL